MRLKPHEVAAIVEAFRPVLGTSGGDLYLFGSRTDDLKKGGDIDLLVVAPLDPLDSIKDETVRISNLIQQKIGEQRIDITVASPEMMRTDPFLQAIANSLVLLHSIAL